jgi:hypothetical protein
LSPFLPPDRLSFILLTAVMTEEQSPEGNYTGPVSPQASGWLHVLMVGFWKVRGGVLRCVAGMVDF